VQNRGRWDWTSIITGPYVLATHVLQLGRYREQPLGNQEAIYKPVTVTDLRVCVKRSVPPGGELESPLARKFRYNQSIDPVDYVPEALLHTPVKPMLSRCECLRVRHRQGS